MVPDSETVVQQHGLTTTVVGLRLEVRPHHFLDGRMQVRCVSTISAGRESLVHQRTAPLIDNREASLLGEFSFKEFSLIIFLSNLRQFKTFLLLLFYNLGDLAGEMFIRVRSFD